MFDNENNTQGTVLFRFLGCEGLGLQQSDSLSKIMADVFQDHFAHDTLYLLDSKGNIRCSVLADKARYEAYDNQDRRQSNIANGFNVLWDQDGRSCTVYNRPAPKSNMKPVAVAALVALVVGALIAWFATWMVMDSRIYEARREEQARARMTPPATVPLQSEAPAAPSTKPTSMSAAEPAQPAADANEAVDAGRRVDLRIEAKTMQSRLQRDNCTPKTVDQVEKWFKNMSAADRRIVCETYPFEEALKDYSRFFNAKNIEDVRSLVKTSGKVFSAKQKVVIRLYAENSKQFHKRQKTYGMRFDIPDSEIRFSSL